MKRFLSLIKFAHTIFALPFAILGFFLGMLEGDEYIDVRLFVLVILCMIFARSAAMAFNRYLDRDIDRLNPRTAGREIPAGIIRPWSALLFVVINCGLFILVTWFINPLCFYLSPVALLIVLGYSYTKRITALCHFVLGLGLSLAPVGAFIAATGYFHIIPVLYGWVVLLWVSGFDIIYSLQDEEFDKENQLFSIPAALGKKRALTLSTALHVLCGLILIVNTYLVQQQYPDLEWIHWIGAVIFLFLLFYQHTLVKPNDLSRVNLAFFTTNGVASLILGALVVLDIFI